MRPGEVDGADYLFVDDAGFDRMIEAGDSWSGPRYTRDAGTAHLARSWSDPWPTGGTCFGDRRPGRRARSGTGAGAILILLTPPSMAALEARLRGRATEDEASIAERLAAAARELEQAGWFDHVVVNDEVGRAADEVAAIIQRSRTR